MGPVGRSAWAIAMQLAVDFVDVVPRSVAELDEFPTTTFLANVD